MTKLSNAIIVPKMSTRTWAVPRWMNKICAEKWQGSAFFWDIDKTLLGSSDVHAPNKLSGRMLIEFVRLLEVPTKNAFITGAHYELQSQRIIEPLVAYLREHKKLELMLNVALSGNRGGSLCVYDEEGNLNKEVFEKHKEQYGIDMDDWPVLEEALKEIIEEYWEKIQKDIDLFHKQYPSFDFELPHIERRGYTQLGVKPFPGAKYISDIILETINRLPEKLRNKYTLVPGGGTTMDINRGGVSKPFAIREICKRWGIDVPAGPVSLEDVRSGKISPLFGGGDEFWVRARWDGVPVLGGDTAMLEIPSLFGLAVNPDQTKIQSLLTLGMGGKEQRVIPLGSGPDASLTFITWANRGEAKEELEMPIEEKISIQIPKSLDNFLGEVIEKGFFVFSGSVLTGFKYGKAGTMLLDPALLEIVSLLKKGIPVVVASGGDYTTRTTPIIEALNKVLDEYNLSRAVLSNVLFYSNGGAVKTGFDKNGDIDYHERFLNQHIIPDKHFESLIKILNELADGYIADKGIHTAHELQYAEVLPHVEERFRKTQLSLLPLLITEKGWMTDLFIEKENNLFGGRYSPHLGGYALDVTQSSVNKAFVIDDASEYFGREHVVFVGGELHFLFDVKLGKILTGIDMEIFKSKKAKIEVAIAVNQDQSKIPEHPLILLGGSGVGAVASWLKYFNQQI